MLANGELQVVMLPDKNVAFTLGVKVLTAGTVNPLLPLFLPSFPSLALLPFFSSLAPLPSLLPSFPHIYVLTGSPLNAEHNWSLDICQPYSVPHGMKREERRGREREDREEGGREARGERV